MEITKAEVSKLKTTAAEYEQRAVDFEKKGAAGRIDVDLDDF